MDEAVRFSVVAPCLLPEILNLVKVSVSDPRYCEITFDSQQMNLLR